MAFSSASLRAEALNSGTKDGGGVDESRSSGLLHARGVSDLVIQSELFYALVDSQRGTTERLEGSDIESLNRDVREAEAAVERKRIEEGTKDGGGQDSVPAPLPRPGAEKGDIVIEMDSIYVVIDSGTGKRDSLTGEKILELVRRLRDAEAYLGRPIRDSQR